MPLLSGIYQLNLDLSNNRLWREEVVVSLLAQQPPIRPSNIAVSLSNTTLPANALRLYLHFSQPMQTGQVRQKIYFTDANGQRDNYAFLATPIELWDTSQKRLTLIFDPGRVKQDVGPNKQIGAPLKANHQNQIVISKGMKAATGSTTSQDHRINLHIGPAERRRLVMQD